VRVFVPSSSHGDDTSAPPVQVYSFLTSLSFTSAYTSGTSPRANPASRLRPPRFILLKLPIQRGLPNAKQPRRGGHCLAARAHGIAESRDPLYRRQTRSRGMALQPLLSVAFAARLSGSSLHFSNFHWCMPPDQRSGLQCLINTGISPIIRATASTSKWKSGLTEGELGVQLSALSLQLAATRFERRAGSRTCGSLVRLRPAEVASHRP